MIDEQHAQLPLHVQKAVVGRLLGFDVLAPELSGLELRGYKDAGARLGEVLCWFTNEALDDPDSDELLDSFLGRLVGKLEAEATSFHNAAARKAVAPILEEFATRVKAFRDRPYDPFMGMIKAVAQTTADYYSTYGATVPSLVWERTLLFLSFLGGKAGLSFAPDVHLQVRTEFSREDPLSAQVFFKIVPRWLDITTIATLPRALLHEYIAHVPQGPYIGVRVHPDADDAFAEGWMDYVAHYVHRSVLERQALTEALSDHLALTWANLYDTAAERFFGARCALQDSDPGAAARIEGAAAARQLHDLLRKLPETKCGADEHLYRLSFGLNASMLDSVSRRRVAAEVRRCLLRASRLDVLVMPLREWVAGRLTLEDLSVRLLA
jgi:hypothetical protein